MRDLLKIIRELEKLPYKSYDRRSTEHDPTDSYFYLERQLAKCIMRDDSLNLDNYPTETEMAGVKQIPISHVCSTDDSKSKDFLVDENLSQVCSMDEGESECVIVD